MPRVAVFVVFALAHFLSNFVRSANAVIAGDLARDIGLGPSELGLMTSTYFLAFAAVQLPLGSALDRFGARLTTPLLMSAAVGGSLLFAVGDSFATLAAGRALLGLGTAGVLMGGLKALSGWFSPTRFAVASGAMVAIGSSGALAASTPLAWAAAAFGWRAVFVGSAFVLAASAASILVWGRAAPGHDAREAPREGSFADVFRRVRFWRIALLGVTTTGTLFAYQSLWAGPYLSIGHGLSAVATGNVLLAMGIGVSSGYLVLGWLGGRLGVAATVLGAGALFVAAQGVLAASPPPGTGALAGTFGILGLSGATSALLFTLARTTFPLTLTGRAVTAANLFMFAGGFALQWGLGAWLEAGLGGYGSLFAITALLSALALLLFVPELRDEARARRPA